MCGIGFVVENGDVSDLINRYWVQTEHYCFLCYCPSSFIDRHLCVM